MVRLGRHPSRFRSALSVPPFFFVLPIGSQLGYRRSKPHVNGPPLANARLLRCIRPFCARDIKSGCVGPACQLLDESVPVLGNEFEGSRIVRGPKGKWSRRLQGQRVMILRIVVDLPCLPFTHYLG